MTTTFSDELFETIKPYTLLSRGRARNLHQLAARVNAAGISGDFVECGTCKGGSAAILGRQIETRKLWLFDSFQGLPPTRAIDGAEASRFVGQCVGSREDVEAVLAKTGLSPDQYLIRAGWFETSLVEPLPEFVALLHCDADWYDSVTIVLETFYPRIPEGGCVILDDFGYWEGCREAFYDFCARHGDKPLLERVEDTQAWWIKGRKHNRVP